MVLFGYPRCDVGRDADESRRGNAVLRFMAMLKAARDFGLDQRSVDVVALRFDPRRPDLDPLADALAFALLR